MKIQNPATGETIKELTEDNASTIQKKYAAARAAQGAWAAKPLADRVAVLAKFHELLDQNRATLSRDLTLEVGKPLNESNNEVNGARGRIQFFLEQSAQHLTQKKINQAGNTEEVLAHDPLGVICNISAWNYPFLVGVNVFVPGLIAGNAVVYKPSEYATLTGLNIEKLLHEAGVPRDVFTCVIGARAAGEALLELGFDGFFFTGSYATGKKIAEKVAHKLVPVGLELGGKDPLYVTDQVASVAQVAGAVAEGCFYNNGQSCCAVERVYVHAKVYDDFINHFVDEVKKLKVGNPLDATNQQGSITRPVHIEFLEKQIQDAVSKGAKVVLGGKKVDGAGAFFEPTVLVNVNHTMSVMKDETFGPVIGVQKVQSDEEALQLMNDCEYGLTAAVYSSDIERAKKVLTHVNAGTSYVNCCDRVSPYLPWAGRKHSGLGATLSYLGILAFSKPRGWHVRS